MGDASILDTDTIPLDGASLDGHPTPDAPRDAGDLGAEDVDALPDTRPDWSPPEDGPHISDAGLQMLGPICDPCGGAPVPVLDMAGTAPLLLIIDPTLNVPPWEDCAGQNLALAIELVNVPTGTMLIRCTGGSSIDINTDYWGDGAETCTEAETASYLQQDCPSASAFEFPRKDDKTYIVFGRLAAHGAAEIEIGP